MLYTKICKYCGNEFKAAQKNKIYCSDKCRKAAFDERRTDARKKRKREMLTYTQTTPERRTPYKNDIPATDPRRRLIKMRARGLLTWEYWNLYAEVDRIYNGGNSVINGIPTTAPYFADAVLAQIEIDGRIYGFTQGSNKNNDI